MEMFLAKLLTAANWLQSCTLNVTNAGSFDIVWLGYVDNYVAMWKSFLCKHSSTVFRYTCI